ncbi:MAG: carboxypeptidase-like regulatory domain-containing protein [Gammaproteobacteria bacterium]|nr:carboxypeptidase-like regulatory domain-containing protein [Gammaproteobacteria bacterium]MBU1444275.1 carboxypeptidase-like regulatory domain-containing protein [Gammaproteobacteria bacterium]MBU2286219.1 carboxypeptidase-like regulatory domain-containing protein [Gammaproteobacteria bacterium]MBU2409989.1 carboxypeptidase-like regulatory domain-containing protein [Gammaproteobacteria bacterium]
MHRPIDSILRVSAACLLAGAPWFAQAQGAMPAMKSQGSGQYVCGGIGSDESTAMRAAMKDHPLSLLFARSGGAYLSDVSVTIKNAQGASAMTLRASGPVCLIDLPDGQYTVEAMAEGVTKSQTVKVGGGPKTADFRF